MTKAIIIEDESIAAIRLQNLIQEVNNQIMIVKVLTSINESIQYLSTESPDLIFLDINLSDGYSFEIFKILEINTPIIFTTAYSEYAIKAFEQNSIDYLLKPVAKNSLSRSIDKFFGLNKNKLPEYKDLFLHNGKDYKKRFLVKMNNSLKTIEIDQIAYFYTEEKLTFIQLWNGKKIPIDFSLKKLEQELDPSNYFRINRKYIIHLKCIEEMYYTSKSRIKVSLTPIASESNIFVAIEKIGKFKKWLSL
ncbi:response regulator transcription factor [Aquimarina sp. MMG015]|uniref:LytR/AlgR family response regulator transcription factor n=1 Tax=Aquimarina TaxID=290174 RepID=UPI000482A15F|nr:MULTISPECIES: LytTR family DNA-binding domain-containing protein [Aquimarina]AXT58548.1 DNA-binding response regulator [Aquimarina sp. AD1]MBQ4804308.1 response regulator transcription factor [Aquimarina sp. MMG015]RKN07487.1 DNA-binding response regulator [Aquimarina sp. AD1]